MPRKDQSFDALVPDIPLLFRFEMIFYDHALTSINARIFQLEYSFLPQPWAFSFLISLLQISFMT